MDANLKSILDEIVDGGGVLLYDRGRGCAGCGTTYLGDHKRRCIVMRAVIALHQLNSTTAAVTTASCANCTRTERTLAQALDHLESLVRLDRDVRNAASDLEAASHRLKQKHASASVWLENLK